MYKVQQSTTAYPLLFFMADSADHITGKTGLTPTVTLSKNGAAFGAAAGAVAEIANGWYKVAGNATDQNTLGSLALHATSAGADPSDTVFEVVIDDLTTSALRPTTAGRTLDVASTGEAGLDFSNILSYVAGIFAPTGITDSGTAQSVTGTTIRLRAAFSTEDNNIIGQTVHIRSGTTGVGQSAIITAYNNTTKDATVAWPATTPTGTIIYDIFSTAPGSSVSPVPVQVVSMAANTLTASALATDAVQEIRDSIFARTFSAAYGGLTFDQVMGVMFATVSAKLSGAGTTTITIRNNGDSANVIVATVDASGNRSAVTITP